VPSADDRRPLLRDASPVEWVHLAFYAFVVAVALLRLPALPTPLATLSWYGGALLGTLALARLLRGVRGLPATGPRVAFAFVAAPVTYLMLGGIVPQANPFHGEAALKAIDDAMFLGRNPNVLLDGLATPWLTEILQIDYSLYYLLPISLLGFLLARRNVDGLARSLFLVLLCLYGSYFGYFLVPATGPNLNVLGLYPEHFSEPMPGVLFAERIRAALLEAEAIKHDCFPSGHTALGVVCVVLARREGSVWGFRLMLPVVVALVFSTMYLRYHYVIDVVAGLLLAWAVLRFGPRLYARLHRPGVDASPTRLPARESPSPDAVPAA
jgi:membrane-associated phospholipid phosphatase